MIGELYEHSLAGLAGVEIEHADERRRPLRISDWLALRPGDASLLDRCEGPTLDVGSGPGRLTVALGERGLPSLGIDITPYAVLLTRRSGGLALQRDVFGRLPGTGRWTTVLLADGNIGIGGKPRALLHRCGELIGLHGRVLVELEPPGQATRTEWVRLRASFRTSDWFPWAYVAADDADALAAACSMKVAERWTDSGRWFAALARSSSPGARTGEP